VCFEDRLATASCLHLSVVQQGMPRAHYALVLLLLQACGIHSVGRSAGEQLAIEISSGGTVSGLSDEKASDRTSGGPATRFTRSTEIELPMPSLQEAASRGGLSGHCLDLLGKAKHLIEFDRKIRADQSLPTYKFQEQAARELHLPAHGKVTQKILWHAEAALGAVTLARALQWGSIWSAEDQANLLIHCNLVEHKRSLEENDITDTGDTIVQGDMVSARCDERHTGKGEGYRGCQSRTQSGLRCQRWDSQLPHSHAWTPGTNSAHDLSENFCRNPNGKRRIWCFTVSDKTRWEHCDPLLDVGSSAGLSDPSASRGIWTSGTVRYCYDSRISMEAKVSVERVMRSVQRQVPCLKFKNVNISHHHNCDELPSVFIKSNSKGCWSHFGQVSGFEDKFKTRSQILNLGPGCELHGMAAHQLGHLLGLRHEANRADRNSYIMLFKENIAGPLNVTFPTSMASALPSKASGAGDFDFLSLMMSGPRAFSTNGSVTLEPKIEPLLRGYLGQRLGFSHHDIQRLSDMYGCLEVAAPESPSRVLSGLFLKGDGMLADERCRDQNYTGVTYVDGTGIPKPYWCGDLANRCFDHEVGSRLRKRCPTTCLMCTPSMAGKLAEMRRDTQATAARAAARTEDRTAHTAAAGTAAGAAAPAPAKTIALAPSANLTPRNATDVPVPPGGCEDAKWTGFKFRSGGEASCGDLEPFCNHHILGQKARQACPKTCGLCDANQDTEIVEVGNKPKAAQNKTNATSCSDEPEEAAPVFTLNGKPAACSDLRQYCRGHNASFLVSKKCELSCGACIPGDGATTTTTFTYTFSTAVGDSPNPGVHCWGFCATRRRRML